MKKLINYFLPKKMATKLTTKACRFGTVTKTEYELESSSQGRGAIP